MKKKYYEPELTVSMQLHDCIMVSGNLEEGESLWNNETPLIPFN